MSAADAAAIGAIGAIESTLRDAAAAVARNDVDGLVAMFHDAPETLLFDFMPPRQTDIDGLRHSFREMNDAAAGPVTCEVLQMRTELLAPDTAWSAALMHVTATMRDGTSLDLVYRATDIWRRIDQRWVVIHEHASMPVDPATGRADLTSAP